MRTGKGSARAQRPSRSLAAYATLACATALGSTSCGAEVSEAEPIGSTTQALGSSEPVTTITTLSQLRAMTVTGNYKLGANINASATATTPFVPIGSPFNPFRGTFDGNGYSISNLKVSSGWYSGLFSGTNAAILKRVALTNANITGGGCTGAIVGIMGNTELTDSYVTGTVTGNAGGSVGMAVGCAGSFSRIFRNYATGTVSGSVNAIGGFIGQIVTAGTSDDGGDPRAWVEEIFTNVTVNPTIPSGSSDVIAGGLVGYVEGASIHDINVVGPVTGRNYVGGILGYVDNDGVSAYKTWLEDSITRGIVTNSATPNRAGCIGGSNDTFLRCVSNYWDRWTDGGSAPPLAPGEDTGCQIGITSTEAKSPHPAPNVLISPYIHALLVTQELIDEGIFDQCKLGSGSDGDWGFGTCDTEVLWALNSSSQYNTLTRIPNPSVQPK